MNDAKLAVSSSPHIRDAANTRVIMRDVLIALVLGASRVPSICFGCLRSPWFRSVASAVLL
jgi:Na+-translocating ferredoxin:NAD+ oxidoreductase RnfD subunit